MGREAVLLALLVFLGRDVRAHEPYSEWQRPYDDGSCCNNSDCRPTSSYHDDDGSLRAKVNGEWIVVPKNTILHIPSPDGYSHICEASGIVYCFVEGEPKS